MCAWLGCVRHASPVSTSSDLPGRPKKLRLCGLHAAVLTHLEATPHGQRAPSLSVLDCANYPLSRFVCCLHHAYLYWGLASTSHLTIY